MRKGGLEPRKAGPKTLGITGVLQHHATRNLVETAPRGRLDAYFDAGQSAAQSVAGVAWVCDPLLAPTSLKSACVETFILSSSSNGTPRFTKVKSVGDLIS